MHFILSAVSKGRKDEHEKEKRQFFRPRAVRGCHHPDRHQDFKLIKEHLALERDIIIKGLERMQMKARSLTSLEILNLFYGFYNSDSLKTQEITKETLQALLKNNYV